MTAPSAMRPPESEPHYLNLNTDIRIMEAAARTTLAHVSPDDSLMQLAGEAVAERAQKMLARTEKNVKGSETSSEQTHALILAGSGNNGGDAWVAARALHELGWTVTIIEPGQKRSQEPAAQRAIKALKNVGVESHKALDDGDGDRIDIMIDGLFGIGLSREVSAGYAALIASCNALSLERSIPILAIDVPSGLNANTGAAFGATTGAMTAIAVVATETITFVGDKVGLHTGDGCELAGQVHVETLGAQQPTTPGLLLRRCDVLPLIPHRGANSHKGSWGNVGIVGGANGMLGAAVLAARAALHMGPGKVYLGAMADGAPPMDLLHPEIMVQQPSRLIADASLNAIAIGMGMGMGMGTDATGDNSSRSLLLNAMRSDAALVLDADALNLLAADRSVEEALAASCGRRSRQKNRPPGERSKVQIVLTPHPGEAARLLGTSTAAIQSDRVTCARKLAKKYGCTVILKGAGTVVSTPLGECSINSSGNAGMAGGGMGDALSGMLAALMAMGLDVHDAAQLGVYLHGAAADAAVQHGMGPHGLTASEVIFEARTLLNTGLEHGHDHDGGEHGDEHINE